MVKGLQAGQNTEHDAQSICHAPTLLLMMMLLRLLLPPMMLVRLLLLLLSCAATHLVQQRAPDGHILQLGYTGGVLAYKAAHPEGQRRPPARLRPGREYAHAHRDM
jgi:uncharacterized membrane protein